MKITLNKENPRFPKSPENILIQGNKGFFLKHDFSNCSVKLVLHKRDKVVCQNLFHKISNSIIFMEPVHESDSFYFRLEKPANCNENISFEIEFLTQIPDNSWLIL